MGHGQDCISTLGNIVAYKDSYKAQDYVGAYEPWKAVFTMAPCAEVSTYAYGAMILATVLVNEQAMARECGVGHLAATDVADYLAKRGLPFREAHAVVGHLVLMCV